MAFLQWLSNKLLPSAELGPDERAIRDAIEQVVEKIDPRLHLVKGYQKKLRGPVQESLRYASEIVDRLPPPLEISSRTWNTDPAVHALFSSIENLKRTVSRSRRLRAFFESPEGYDAEYVFAVLGMTKRETRRFGTELEGDSIQREVLQTAVGFVDIAVGIPAATEAEVRTALKQAAFEETVLHALHKIASMKTMRTDLEKDRAMLQMRHRLLQGSLGEAESVFGGGPKSVSKLQAVEAELAANNTHLREMFGSFQTLEYYLEQVTAVLEHPHEYLRLTPTSVRLNRMNIVVDEHDKHGNTIDLLEVAVTNRPPRVVLLVKYPRAELLPKEDFLKMARRYLG